VPAAVTDSVVVVFRAIVMLAGCCVIVVAGLTVTVTGADCPLVQPLAFVTVTENVPLVLTTIDCVVSPSDQ
jgi:hypothetical protein